MFEKTQDHQTSSLDNQQAAQFYRTATNPRRLPKKYWPTREVEVDLFNDAVIGHYEDAVMRKHKEAQESMPFHRRANQDEIYRREMARIAAAVDYVRGVPISEIHRADLGNEQMQKEGAFNYVLQVAKGGAEEIKRLHREEQPASHDVFVDAPEHSSEEQLLPDEKSLRILTAYIDVEDRIKKLYHEHRIDKESAQALVMLLELQRSTASPERQISALYNVRCELERKIMNWMFSKETDYSSDQNVPLEKGVAYIQKVIGRPKGRIIGLRPYRLIKEVETETGEDTTQLKARNHVYSHIGYALDKLYHL